MSDFPALRRELDERPEDTEHCSVSVTHETEWCISVSRGGYVIFEHLEDGEERHMRGVPDATILQLRTQLSEGNIAAIEQQPWAPRYQ